MSTLRTSDLVRTTRRYLQGAQRDLLNELDGAITAGNDTFTLRYPPTGLQAGSSLEVGWVEYLVTSVTTSGNTVTVMPAIEGTAASHADGARVLIKPRHPTRAVIEELNFDLRALSARGIFKLRAVDASTGAVTVPDDAQVLLDVWNTDGTRLPNSIFRIGDNPTPGQSFNLTDTRFTGTLDFAVFGCPLSDLSYTTDADVSVTGLVSTAEDIPPMGAAIRLLAAAEAQRNLIDIQGDTRRAVEVPPGGITTALRNLAALRERRLVEEGLRYTARYGLKLHLAV
jgi:hypothetical protein